MHNLTIIQQSYEASFMNNIAIFEARKLELIKVLKPYTNLNGNL